MLGEIIKEGRRKKKITQLELANYLGISKSAVFAWEKNVNVPSGDMLIKIVKKLDIVDRLFPQETVEKHPECVARFEKLEQEIKELRNIVRLLLERNGQ